MPDAALETLDEAECWRLIEPGGIGRDDIDAVRREGWSVLVQGPAHHLDSEAERADARTAGVEPWPGGEREHFIRITPVRITGRRIRRVART